MNRPTDDKDFEEYLGRQTEVSQRYLGLEADDVPAHLDQKVLAQARAAVAADSDELSRVRRQRKRLAQWGVPTALAASALLVVSIVMRSGTQHEITPANAPVSSPMPAPAPASPPPAAAEQVAKPAAEQSDPAADVIMIAPPRDAVTEFSPLGRPSVQPQQKQAPASAAPPAEAGPIGQAVPSSPVSAAAPPPPAMVARAGAEAELAASRAAATAASNEAAKSRRAEEERIVVTGQRRQASVQDSPVAITVLTGSDAGIQEPQLYRLTQESWLERIRELRREGNNAEADKEWKAFVEAHPGYPVDEKDLARGTR